MALEPKDMRGLMLLINGSGAKVENADDLLQLLRAANKVEVSPEIRREELTALAQRQDKEHAFRERLRQLEHKERMESLERGIPLPDPERTQELASLKRSSIVASACVATIIPAAGFILGLMCMSLVLQLHELNSNAVGVCAIVWGVIGIVSLVSVALCLVNILINRSVPSVKPLSKPIQTELSEVPAPSHASRDTYVTTGASPT
ncbi:MAG: hypothetical protein ACFCD0_01580 [Gemmataceae bacterium]